MRFTITAVARGHFDAWSTDQEFPIVILIWQTRFSEIAVFLAKSGGDSSLQLIKIY